MNATEAAELKQLLKDRAASQDIDLRLPRYKYTLWTENGRQGYYLRDSGPVRQAVYQTLGDQLFSIHDAATILEINESGDCVKRFEPELG